MPAAHAVPSPVSTSTPTSSRNSSALSTSIISRLSVDDMQLRLSGRLNFTQAMRSTTSYATVPLGLVSVIFSLFLRPSLEGRGWGGSASGGGGCGEHPLPPPPFQE